MRWTHLVTLMEAEATRQEQANDHPAAILLREGAEALRKANRSPGVGMAPLDLLIGTPIQERRGNAPALTPRAQMPCNPGAMEHVVSTFDKASQ